MLINIQQVSKSFLDDVVLRGVSLEIQQNDRIGLLGANAAGKTTLLNIIAGRLAPDDGQVLRAKNLEIGYLRQNDALEGSRTLDEEARDAFRRVYALQAEMDAAAKALEAAGGNNEALLAEYGTLAARFEALDGYALDAKIDRVLSGLGFAGFDRATLVNTLSGGEKMRFSIAKMLLRQPDLLMLDEPTNHLDFEMLSWLEDYLRAYKGAVLVVSHDRYFLDTVAQDICEIEAGELTRYPGRAAAAEDGQSGAYAAFVTQKAEHRRTALRAWEKQQVEIAKMEDYVRRNQARASTAASATSRVKALDRMERLKKPRAEAKTIALRFDYDVEPFSTILRCEGLGVRVGADEPGGGRQLYSGLSLEVQRGEKLALVGLNGVGKSTFLKAIQNLLPHDGRVQWGGNVRLGYFDQELAGLDPELTALEAVHSQYPTKTEFEIRSALGRMLLEGDDVYKKVRALSGAGRAKVAFTILVMRRANVLVMDEPTNHLDYRAKEVLEGALRAYTGTLIAVSHDRYFLRRVPDKILEMYAGQNGEAGGFDIYPGNYDDYLELKDRKLQQAAQAVQAAGPTAEAAPKATGGNYRSKAQRAQEAQARARLSALEKEIARLEEAIEAHNATLTAPENASDFALLAAESETLTSDTAALDVVMEEWLALHEE